MYVYSLYSYVYMYISRRIVPCRVVSCRIASRRVASRRVASRRVASRRVVFNCTIACSRLSNGDFSAKIFQDLISWGVPSSGGKAPLESNALIRAWPKKCELLVGKLTMQRTQSILVDSNLKISR